MIDTKALKAEATKTKRKSRKPAASSVKLDIYFDGEIVDVINPNSLSDWAIEHNLDPIACDTAMGRPWCSVNGYAFDMVED